MTKEQKDCVFSKRWRELLTKATPIGETAIVVSSVGDIKSLRSVASDINTDRSEKRKISIEADRDVLQVKIHVSEKS